MNIYNDSHCADLTAAEAIRKIEREPKDRAEEKRARNLIGIMLRVASLAGYTVHELTVEDNVTGKKYKKVCER